jgi:hypothetical protein
MFMSAPILDQDTLHHTILDSTGAFVNPVKWLLMVLAAAEDDA